MKEQELNELIDKGIGIKGPLKIPAFWMRKILNNVLVYIKENVDSLTKLINDSIKQLDKTFNKIDETFNTIDEKFNDPKLCNKSIENLTFRGQNVYLNPNTYTKIKSDSDIEQINIYFNTSNTTEVINEYLLEFTTGSYSTSLIFNEDIKWLNGEFPTLELNTTYQISIVNNLGIVGKFV